MVDVFSFLKFVLDVDVVDTVVNVNVDVNCIVKVDLENRSTLFSL
ncbi:hypothetical protein GCM10008904_11860 [Paraclostridium ghonii]